MSHWPIHPHPEPDEVTSSWLVRLAVAHGIKLQSFCCSVWGREANIWNRDIDKLPVKQIFDVLSEKTLTPMERVLDTHLSSFEGKLYRHHNPYGNQNWILPIRVYHRLRTAHGQQFCPHCLEESVYLRKHWRLALVTCCEVHGTQILDRCPSCQLPMHFHRDDMGNRGYLGKKSPALCFNCQFDLRRAVAPAVDVEQVKRQKVWLRGIQDGVIGDHEFAPDYFDVLRHLATLMVSHYRMVRNIGEHAAAAKGVEWIQPVRSSLNIGLEGLSVADRARLLDLSAWLLEQWPKRFVSFCQEHEIWSAALTKELPDAPAWYGDVVQTYLKRDIWKGTPDLMSKRAINWKPIKQVLSDAKRRRPVLKAA